MRIFWLVILALAAVTGIVLWRSASAGSAGGNAPRAGSIAKIDAPPSSATAQNPGALTPAVKTSGAAPDVAVNNLSPFATQPPASPASANSKSDAAALAQDLLDSSGKADGEGDVVADALDDGSTAPAHTSSSKTADAATPNAGVIDGKYIVAGDGSVKHPYEITWDLLVLASHTYQPRQGKTDIPPQVKAIDQHHIKIAGYFAFPIASTDPKEVLFMLNMWDGCCIGVPPSPYDAIEVRLKEPMANARKQFTNYGTLTGTLKVDPYVQNGWLLGMYVMEDGAIEAGM